MSSKSIFALIAVLSVFFATADGTPAASQKPQKPSREQIDTLIEKTKANLIPMKGGSFDMGDWGLPNGLPIDANMDSKPMHKVTLDPFSMLKYKVTFQEFDTFTDAVGEPRVDTAPYRMSVRLPNYPVEVSWYGAQAYCQWLAKTTGMKFNLPTEAQWEFAARSGGSKNYLYATDNGQLDYGRNYPLGGLNDNLRFEVGKYPPNAAGFDGMSDMRIEWVFDWYDRNYYQSSPENNPGGPKQGTKKVVRGADGSPDTTGLVVVRDALIPKKNEEDSDYKKYETKFSGLISFRCVVN